MATVETDLEIMIRLPYAVEVVPDRTTDGEPCYLATHPELPGCMAHGDTTQEAMNNLADARRLYISTLLERGQEVPLPEAAETAGTSQQAGISAIWKLEFSDQRATAESQESASVGANYVRTQPKVA